MKRTLAVFWAAAWLLTLPAQAAAPAVERVPVAEKIIALTVEDVASAAQLDELLILFRDLDIKATFFVEGRLAGRLPLKKAAGLGHEIGNHSLTHPFWGEAGAAEIAGDLAAAAKAIEAVAGKAPVTVRPPYDCYGDNFLQAVQALGPPAVAVRGKDAGDWLVDAPDALAAEIVRTAAPGDIINFNLQAKTAAAALPTVVAELKRAGFGIVTAATLLAKTASPPPEKPGKPAAFAVVSQASAAGRLALTFDDGGTPRQVGRILAVLGEAGIRATFFLTGRWAAENPGLVSQIAAGGHEIANHSYSHPCLPWLSREEAQDEILAAQEILTRLAGAPPRLFRPPYGAYDGDLTGLVRELGFRAFVLWDVDTRDWSGAAAGTIFARVAAGASAGSIILFHLQGPHTAEALEDILPSLRAGGYHPTTVSDLLDN